MRIKARHAAAAGAIVLATTLIAGFEGYVPYVYRDAVGVKTYCYGETQNPRAGHHYTKQECTAQLSKRVAEFDAQVRNCMHVSMPAKVEAAYTDFAYNLGAGNFCRYIAPLANAGKWEESCHKLTHFNHAGGRILRGLTVRRGKEEEFCLEGVREAGL